VVIEPQINGIEMRLEQSAILNLQSALHQVAVARARPAAYAHA
jgi:hypothetical protein